MPGNSKLFFRSGSEKPSSTLTPPLSDVASLSDPEGNEVEPDPSASTKLSRLSISMLRSKSDFSTLRSILPRRHSIALEPSSTSVAPLEDSDIHELNGNEKQLSTSSSPLIPTIFYCENEPSAAKPKSKFNRKSNSQKTPVKELIALEGEDIASRLKLRTASIDGEFHKIEYGQYKGRPACLITVDLRLVYQPENTISKVKVDFQFGPLCEELDEKATPTERSPISKVLTPVELEGIADRSKDTQHTKWEPEISAFSIKGKVGGGGGHKTVNAKHRWRVQGQTEEHDDVYDTFRWRIMENSVSEDSVPRHVRLGMIVFHKHERFWMQTTIEGSLRGSMRGKGGLPFKAIKEKRWFDPPTLEELGQDVLHEGMLQNRVGSYNLQIVDVEPDRKLERQLTTLIDFSAMNVNADQDGGGMIMGTAEQDLLSTFTNDADAGADSYG